MSCDHYLSANVMLIIDYHSLHLCHVALNTYDHVGTL